MRTHELYTSMPSYAAPKPRTSYTPLTNHRPASRNARLVPPQYCEHIECRWGVAQRRARAGEGRTGGDECWGGGQRSEEIKQDQ
jgi:hypothetical protein